MIPETLYFSLGTEVIAFQAIKPLEVAGTVDVRIQTVRNGVAKPSEVTDLLSEGDYLQLLADHRAAGWQECNRFGRPLDPKAFAQVPPPLHLPVPDAAPDAAAPAPTPVPLPVVPDRGQPQEPTVPKPTPSTSLEDILQKIEEKTQGWADLTPEEQQHHRTSIYNLRSQARRVAEASGYPSPKFPAIPPVDQVAAEAEEEAEDEERIELEEEVITLDSIKGAVASLKRQVWLVMADVQALEPAEQVEVARELDGLSKAARCGSSSLGDQAIYPQKWVPGLSAEDRSRTITAGSL